MINTVVTVGLATRVSYDHIKRSQLQGNGNIRKKMEKKEGEDLALQQSNVSEGEEK